MSPNMPKTSPSKLLAVPSPPARPMVAGQAAKPCQEGAQSQAGGQEVDRPVGSRSGLGGRCAAEQGAFRLDQRPLARFSRMRTSRKRSRIRSGRNASSHRVMVRRSAGQAQVEAEVLGKKIRSHAKRVRSKVMALAAGRPAGPGPPTARSMASRTRVEQLSRK